MKTTLWILCLFLFCATLTYGQAAVGVNVLSSQPVPLQVYSNPKHASHQAMAEEQNLLQPSAYTHAQGQRPLWEVVKIPEGIPLGDVARAFREGHTVVKKSEVVWVNQ